MGILDHAQKHAQQEAETDAIGGDDLFGKWDTGIYDCTIKMAYVEKKDSGATFINLVLEDDLRPGSELKEGICIVSGNAKGNKTYYVKKGKDGEADKQYALPGFSLMTSICAMTNSPEVCALEDQEKYIDLYNFDTKKREATAVPALVQLIGKKLKFAVVHERKNKQTNVAPKGAKADYKNTAEEQFINEIDRVFDSSTGLTLLEAMTAAKASTDPVAETIGKWKDKWLDGEGNGITKDTYKAVAGASAAATPDVAFGGTAAAGGAVDTGTPDLVFGATPAE